MKGVLKVILLTGVVTGCANTKITSFVDPDYKGKVFKRLLVSSPNLNHAYSQMLQSKICKKLTKYETSCIEKLRALPPTRDYSQEDILKYIEKNKIDGYLMVYFANGDQQTNQVGSFSYGNASIYGNTMFGSSVSMPMYSTNRTDNYNLVLIDTEKHSKAWVGGAVTSGSGSAVVTHESFTNSLSSEIVNNLFDSGFLSGTKKQSNGHTLSKEQIRKQRRE